MKGEWMDVQMYGQMDKTSPCVLQDFLLFGAAAPKTGGGTGVVPFASKASN